jgi:PAS domain S-box-containing protein
MKKRSDNTLENLEERLRILEDGRRFTIDALDMAASLGDFQSAVNHLQTSEAILKETDRRIRRLLALESSAFYLVDNGNQEFQLRRFDPSEPRRNSDFIASEVEFLIENETFAWALREKRPVIVSTRNGKRRILLHVLSTVRRIRGMFVGVFDEGGQTISDVALSLLSIILLNSANTLESYENRKMREEIRCNLEKEKNYRMLFESSPDGIEVLDACGVVVECNKAQQELVGRNARDMIGRHTTNFFSPDSKTHDETAYPVLKESGSRESEVDLVHRNGTVIPVWRKARAIYDEKGLFVGAIINNRDISALKKADEEKRMLSNRLQQAQHMESLGVLAGGVAHDLNNILSGLVSYPDLLLRQLPEGSSLRKPILTIMKSGEKAAAVVQDLLTLARRGVVSVEAVNLNAIVSEYLESPDFGQLKSHHPEVAFEISLDKDLLNMMASPAHLRMTVANLVANAVDDISGRGRVVVSTSNRYLDASVERFEDVREGEYVSLTVSDDGVGVAEADIKRIFEPFYTKKVLGRSGTGLGMAVVWGAVQDHEGYLDAQSREGTGMTITVCIPATRRERNRPSLSTGGDYCGAGESVLVIDDVQEQREIASGMLTKLGYRVTVAASGEEAVAQVKRRPVDLLVIDMIMAPGIDGLDTYKQILREYPAQKAILVSGFSESKRIREARKLGVSAYVKKPYLFESIGKAAHDALKKREADR